MTSDRPRAAGPLLTYLRLWSDDDGESHFGLRPLRGDADPEAGGRELLDEGGASGYSLRVVHPGWTREWGPSKARILGRVGRWGTEYDRPRC